MGFKNLVQDLMEDLLDYCAEAPVFDFTFYAESRVVIRIKHMGVPRFAQNLREYRDLKYDDKIGIRVLIALCDTISITTGDSQEFVIASAKQGNYDPVIPGPEEVEKTITLDFTLDPTIFKDFVIKYNDITPFLQQFAYLNSELKIIGNDRTGEELQRNVFHYPKGISMQLDDMIQQAYYPFVWCRTDIEAIKNGYHYRIALCNNVWNQHEFVKTFAGNIEMLSGGSLENGIVQGISRFLKIIADSKSLKIRATKKEVKRHLVFMAVVKGKDFVFEGSTRKKLGMKEIQQDVRELVSEHLMASYESGNEDIKGLADRFIAWEGIEEAEVRKSNDRLDKA
jgi:DNA gyrase/topoisomerase IV subunit B